MSHLHEGKSKVAPLITVTFAGLELQAALFGSRSIMFVRNELRLEVAEVHVWTDSTNVWYWLQPLASVWKKWVANRVTSIHEVSRKLGLVWRHWPGHCNPADVTS